MNSHARLCGSLIRRPCDGPQGPPRAGDFLMAPFARESQFVGCDRPQRSGRSIVPDGVDRVQVDRDQAGAGFLAGRREARDGLRRVKSRVIAKLVVRLEAARDPLAWRLTRDLAEFEHRRVRLGLHLLRVSPVDEQSRRVFQHHGNPRRAREPGQPPEPLRVRRGRIRSGAHRRAER